MASISIRNPEDVLVGLASDRWSNDPVFANIPTYWCAKCDDITQFSLKVKEPPQFTFAIRKAMDDASGPVIPYETNYCDFCCKHCGQPVRVKYDEHEFAMSSYRYLPKVVYLYESAL